MENIGSFRVETFPLSRISTIDVVEAGLKKHHVKALIELDVTEARRRLTLLRQQKRKVSFNAWLIKCISETISQFKQVHGVRKGKKSVVIFEDIDISILIEREVKGEKVPLPYVIRRTNEKSIEQITQEITRGKQQPIQNLGDNVLGEKKQSFLMKLYYMLPGLIRRLIWTLIIQSPLLTKQNMGTVVFTSVGIAGKLKGWVIPVGVHPLCFGVGSIVKKPGVIDNRIEIREYLYMTVLLDHDVVDGAPAVRALSKLTELIESGIGLD